MAKKKKKNKSSKAKTATPTKQASSGAPRAKGGDEGGGPSDKQIKWARIASIGLGLVFLLAGTLKVSEPWAFLGSLPAYGIPPILRLPITVVVPAFEVALGVMLIAGWRTRIASMASAGLLGGFAAVISYGWATGTLLDCGCFGPLLQRTPPEALAMDAVFLGMAAMGMMWAPNTKMEFTRFRIGTLATLAVGSMALIGGTLWSDTSTLSERIASSEAVVNLGGPSLASLDLDNRDVFLYLFHPDCPHCVRNGPRMALIADDARLPEVIGITTNIGSARVQSYLDHAGAEINAFVFSTANFVQITGDASVPQFVYLSRGQQVRHWKGDLPTRAELRAVVEANSE
jgi:uncharacterized membrane protein YphA (DoxX/SURF4 family)